MADSRNQEASGTTFAVTTIKISRKRYKAVAHYFGLNYVRESLIFVIRKRRFSSVLPDVSG